MFKYLRKMQEEYEKSPSEALREINWQIEGNNEKEIQFSPLQFASDIVFQTQPTLSNTFYKM